MKKLMAFWRYDKFPYVLAGEVVRITDSGRVETREYGPGRTFQAFRILPLAAGRKILAELDALERKRAAEVAELEKRYLAARDRVISPLKVPS